MVTLLQQKETKQVQPETADQPCPFPHPSFEIIQLRDQLFVFGPKQMLTSWDLIQRIGWLQDTTSQLFVPDRHTHIHFEVIEVDFCG